MKYRVVMQVETFVNADSQGQALTASIIKQQETANLLGVAPEKVKVQAVEPDFSTL